MNWLQRIKNLIGKFWTVVCQDVDFVLGTVSMHAVADKVASELYARWSDSYVAKLGGRDRDLVPVVVYLVKSRITEVTDDNGGTAAVSEDCITKPPISLDMALAGDASQLNARDEAGGWQMPLLRSMPAPGMLTDHVLDYRRTLVEKMDYDWYGDHVLFHMDPSGLGLPAAMLYDAQGRLCTCYKLFGWFTAPALLQDAVAGCESPALSPYSATTWEMHQEGCTYYNMKKLLAEVTGSVVCEESGVVSRKWEEQGYTCLQIGKRAYTVPADVQCNVGLQDSVEQGDILMGSLVVCSGSDLDDSEILADIPGIRVRTDAGELFAANDDMSVIVQEGVDILPLTSDGDPETVSDIEQAYRDDCVRLAQDSLCPQIDLEAANGVINPFMFIMRKLRRGRSVLVSATAGPIVTLGAAFDCIRRNMPASGMLTAYVREQQEAVTALEAASFTASAGNAAVAVAATVKVKAMAAEAEVVL